MNEHRVVWVARYLNSYDISFQDCTGLSKEYIHPDTKKLEKAPFRPYYLSPVEIDEEYYAREQ